MDSEETDKNSQTETKSSFQKKTGFSSFSNKKRNIDEISSNLDTDQYLPTTGTDGSASVPKQSSDLWTKKYTPFSLDTHVINKKKKEDFVNLCTKDQKIKVLFLQGPSGCGKNSMIDCFGEQYNYEVIRYKDERSSNVVDVYGLNAGFDSDEENGDGSFKRRYPDDLEKMLYTIKTITKAAMFKVGDTQVKHSNG
jgi:hypothetical protein